MSHSCHSKPSPEFLEPTRVSTLRMALLVIGLLSLIATAFIGMQDMRQLAFSWLFAVIVCYTVCVGSTFWILLHHAVDARWSVVVRRVLENVASLFPYLALAFIPLVYMAPYLWKWMLLAPGADPLLDHKSGYLNKTFFYIRMTFYLGYFSFITVFFRNLSISQDKDGNPYPSLWMRKISYVGIPLLALSITFSAFDWLMALDFHWASTMWGVYIFAGSVLSSMAVLILISNALNKAGYLQKIFTPEHNHAMGKLLLAFTIFWGYISFSQYFLIYYANIPEETTFYIFRNEGEWRWMSMFLVVAHFIIPFLLLLTQPAKLNSNRLCFIAGWILTVHVVDIYWIIMPIKQVLENKLSIDIAESSTSISPHLVDFTALIAIASLLGFFLIRRITSACLFPVRDHRLAESIQLKN